MIMRVKKEYTVICIEEKCGCEFIAFSPKALRCPKCKEEHLRLAAKLKQSKCRKNAKQNKNLPKMSINDVLKAMKKYNEEHGTYHTYGQFVSLMERGIINVGE
jgi:hypothetical protein